MKRPANRPPAISRRSNRGRGGATQRPVGERPSRNRADVADARHKFEEMLRSSIQPLTESEVAEELKAFDQRFFETGGLVLSPSRIKTERLLVNIRSEGRGHTENFTGRRRVRSIEALGDASLGPVTGIVEERNLEEPIDYAKNRLLDHFRGRVAERLKDYDAEARAKFVRDLASHLGIAAQFEEANSGFRYRAPPDVAPRLWVNRDPDVTSPRSFIETVYADYLGRGLTQAHLLSLDRTLLQLYLNEVRGGAERIPAYLLPTKTEWIDQVALDPRIIAQLPDEEQHKVHRTLAARAVQARQRKPK